MWLSASLAPVTSITLTDIDRGNIASQKVALKTGLTYEKDIQMEGEYLRVYAIYQTDKSLKCK